MIHLFNEPKLIGLIADVNSGKSNALYHIITEMGKNYNFNLYSFGLKFPQGNQIFSLEELEQIKNSLVIIDECMSLFDLDNRNKKNSVEDTLRLIHHNNNIIILSILPENGKKFIASKMTALIFKRCTIADFINGSAIKRVVTQYCGPEKGAAVLNIPLDKALIFDGKTYSLESVPYYEKFDSKKKNEQIFKKKGKK
jgi:hypothetical protein